MPHGMRDGLAVWQQPLGFSGGRGEHRPPCHRPPEKPRMRARAQYAPRRPPPTASSIRRSAPPVRGSLAGSHGANVPRCASHCAQHSPSHPLPPPPPRTAGPRSAGQIAGSGRSDGTGALPPSEMRDKPGACGTSLGFSGGHSSVDRTPYGLAPLKSHVSERWVQHSPSRPFPNRRSVPPVSWIESARTTGRARGLRLRVRAQRSREPLPPAASAHRRSAIRWPKRAGLRVSTATLNEHGETFNVSTAGTKAMATLCVASRSCQGRKSSM